MDEQAKESAFMSALITEHFVLQSAASTTVSEAAARASLYVFSLSSALVAMGFAAASPDVFVPFVATVLPAIFVLGWFTVVRLVDTTVENNQYLRAIARIRRYYRGLMPEKSSYFAGWQATENEAQEALAMLGTKGGWTTVLFTTASMVAAINSLVGGVGIALLAAEALGHTRDVIAILFGALATVASAVIAYVYQVRRLSAAAEADARRLGSATQ
jgi:hypothetical protein